MPPTRIDVAAAAGAYPVFIGAGTLATLPRLLDDSGPGPRRIIVSSPVVWGLHGDALRHASTDAEPILIPDGERFKNNVTVGRVYEGLIERGADRSTVILAVGGGVDRRSRRLCGGNVSTRRTSGASSDDADGAGRQRRRREGRHQSSARKKPHRRVSPTSPGDCRSGCVVDLAATRVSRRFVRSRQIRRDCEPDALRGRHGDAAGTVCTRRRCRWPV